MKQDTKRTQVHLVDKNKLTGRGRKREKERESERGRHIRRQNDRE